MNALWIFLVVALFRFIYKRVTEQKNSRKVTANDLTQRFNQYTNQAELVAEYLRLLLLNKGNPEALRAIEELYLAAKARLDSKGTRQRTKRDAKARSIREKNEKIFSNISTLEELKRKYRKLSQANHPDHGGNLTAMKRLNELYEEALERISSSK